MEFEKLGEGYTGDPGWALDLDDGEDPPEWLLQQNGGGIWVRVDPSGCNPVGLYTSPEDNTQILVSEGPCE